MQGLAKPIMNNLYGENVRKILMKNMNLNLIIGCRQNMMKIC